MLLWFPNADELGCPNVEAGFGKAEDWPKIPWFCAGVEELVKPPVPKAEVVLLDCENPALPKVELLPNPPDPNPEVACWLLVCSDPNPAF